MDTAPAAPDRPARTTSRWHGRHTRGNERASRFCTTTRLGAGFRPHLRGPLASRASPPPPGRPPRRKCCGSGFEVGCLAGDYGEMSRSYRGTNRLYRQRLRSFHNCSFHIAPRVWFIVARTGKGCVGIAMHRAPRPNRELLRESSSSMTTAARRCGCTGSIRAISRMTHPRGRRSAMGAHLRRARAARPIG